MDRPLFCGGILAAALLLEGAWGAWRGAATAAVMDAGVASGLVDRLQRATDWPRRPLAVWAFLERKSLMFLRKINTRRSLATVRCRVSNREKIAVCVLNIPEFGIRMKKSPLDTTVNVKISIIHAS